jgi:hypothetical protein
VAGFALDPKKALFESAALEVGLELLLDVTRQRPLLRRAPIAKRRIVLGNQPIEQCRLGLVAPVTRRRDEASGLCNILRRRAHARHPCTTAIPMSLGAGLRSTPDNDLVETAAFCATALSEPRNLHVPGG